jgi:subfamily B ATP-binding cassette protein MsbA
MFRRFVRYLFPYRLLMAGVVSGMLMSTLVEMANPWPLKIILDNVLGFQPLFGREIEGPAQQVLLALAAGGFILLAGLKGSLAALRSRWVAQVSQSAGQDMRRDLYAQLQRLSLRFHDTSRTGDLITRITSDVARLQNAFVSGLSIFTVDMLSVIGIAVVMFLVDWQFALVAMGVVPTLVLIYSRFRGRVRRASVEARRSEGNIASVVQEVLSSIRIVKAFGQEEREQERFDARTRSLADASVEVATWEGLFSLWIEVVTATGIAAVLWYGGWRVLSGNLTVGELVLFMQYLTTLYSPLRRLSRLTTLVQRASASAERLDEIFRLQAEVEEAPHAVPVRHVEGRIRFERVDFAYYPGQPVLKQIDLELRPGETLALIGPTGAGKSTLVSLIPRFYDPTAGRVLLDGHDLRGLQIRSLRDQISIVLQDTALFSGTIRDNIAYGRPDASDEEIVAAAKAAHAHEFIESFPQGYQTPVGERGVTLSGGQRQRIAIARALLKGAPILILDEPTSAVDRRSETLILEALARLMQGRTVIIIAHRLGTLDLVDRVAVLIDGRIAYLGTPEGARRAHPDLVAALQGSPTLEDQTAAPHAPSEQTTTGRQR